MKEQASAHETSTKDGVDTQAQPDAKKEERRKRGANLMIAGAVSFGLGICMDIGLMILIRISTGSSAMPGGVEGSLSKGVLSIAACLFMLGGSMFLVGLLLVIQGRPAKPGILPPAAPIAADKPASVETAVVEQSQVLPDQPEALVNLLGEPHDPGTRRAAAAQLRTIGGAAVPALLSGLSSRYDLSTRCAAARILGRIGDPRAADKLAEIALGFENKSLGADAGKALLAIGEPALGALLKGLKRPRSMESSQAASLLGRLGDARAVAPLTAAMKAASRSARGSIVKALGQIGDPKAVAALVEALEYPEVRPAAARWLKKYGADSVPPLMSIIQNDDAPPTTRWSAADVLKTIDKKVWDDVRDRLPAKPEAARPKAQEAELSFPMPDGVDPETAKLIPLLEKARKVGWSEGFRVYEDYPQYKRIRAIGQRIYNRGGYEAMNRSHLFIRAMDIELGIMLGGFWKYIEGW